MDCDIWKPHKNQQHGHKDGGGGGGGGGGVRVCNDAILGNFYFQL